MFLQKPKQKTKLLVKLFVLLVNSSAQNQLLWRGAKLIGVEYISYAWNILSSYLDDFGLN